MEATAAFLGVLRNAIGTGSSTCPSSSSSTSSLRPFTLSSLNAAAITSLALGRSAMGGGGVNCDDSLPLESCGFVGVFLGLPGGFGLFGVSCLRRGVAGWRLGIEKTSAGTGGLDWKGAEVRAAKSAGAKPLVDPNVKEVLVVSPACAWKRGMTACSRDGIRDGAPAAKDMSLALFVVTVAVTLEAPPRDIPIPLPPFAVVGAEVVDGGVEGARSSSCASPVSEHNEGVGSVIDWVSKFTLAFLDDPCVWLCCVDRCEASKLLLKELSLLIVVDASPRFRLLNGISKPTPSNFRFIPAPTSFSPRLVVLLCDSVVVAECGCTSTLLSRTFFISLRNAAMFSAGTDAFIV